MLQEPRTAATWDELTPDEKLERRLAAWASTEGRTFVSPEAEQGYKARVKRFVDAFQLRKPDRVPVIPAVGNYAAYYAGFNERDMMYDADKVNIASKTFTLDFDPDSQVIASGLPGKPLETLGYSLYHWPGHGVSEDSELQFVEGEYLKADEIDLMLEDPTDFWIRTYFPRTMGALAGLAKLAPFPYRRTQIAVQLVTFGLPEVQEALEKILQAGREALAFMQKVGAGKKELEALGYPSITGGVGGNAPFDVYANSLRGTREMSLDLFRRPDKVLEAVERITPAVIRGAMEGASLGGSPIIWLTLHRGSDGFMSETQFRTLYWPQLRRVILAIVEEGLVPLCVGEGTYDSRLEIIRDLPRGKVIWWFDQTDMARAKAVLGDVCSIMGNVPLSLLHKGTADDVTAWCRTLIDTAGKDGGFILSPGGGVTRGVKADNLRAMINCAREYGVSS